MSNEIVNRVAKSPIISVDLEEFYPKGKRITIDISQWLKEGLLLVEKDFRKSVEEHQWSQYNNSFVALFCSTGAIIPSWAYILVTTKLHNIAKKIVVGNLELLESIVFNEIILKHDFSIYKNKPVIIKGCSNLPIPSSAYSLFVDKTMEEAKSIMFGEACSNVPLYKQKK